MTPQQNLPPNGLPINLLIHTHFLDGGNYVFQKIKNSTPKNDNYFVSSSNFELFNEHPVEMLGGFHYSMRIASFYDQKPVVVEKCCFLKCYALGGILTSCTGGAIHAYNVSLQVCNCVFGQCLAKYAGAIAAGNDNFSINHSSFASNKATDSIGAVWSMSAINASVSDCNFSYNEAAHEVGALDFNCSNPTLSRCNFAQNVTNTTICHVAFTGDKAVYVSDCHFEDVSLAAYMIYFESSTMKTSMDAYLKNVFFDAPNVASIQGDGNIYIYFSGYHCSSSQHFYFIPVQDSIINYNKNILFDVSLDYCIEYFSTPSPSYSLSPTASISTSLSPSLSISSSLSVSSSPFPTPSASASLTPTVSQSIPPTPTISPSLLPLSSQFVSASATPPPSVSRSPELQEEEEIQVPQLAAGLGGSLLMLLLLAVLVCCLCKRRKKEGMKCCCCKRKESAEVNVSLKVPIHDEDFEFLYPYSIEEDPPWVVFLSPMWRGGVDSEDYSYSSSATGSSD